MERNNPSQNQEKYDELMKKVNRLSEDRSSLEKRIQDLEERMTGSSDKDQTSFKFIVEKQTTEMQVNQDRGPAGIRPGRRDVYSASTGEDSDAGRPSPTGKVVRLQDAFEERNQMTVVGDSGKVTIYYPKEQGDDEDRGRTRAQENNQIDKSDVRRVTPIIDKQTLPDDVRSRDEENLDRNNRNKDAQPKHQQPIPGHHNNHDTYTTYTTMPETDHKSQTGETASSHLHNDKKEAEGKDRRHHDEEPFDKEKDAEKLMPRVIVVTAYKDQEPRNFDDNGKEVCAEDDVACHCRRMIEETEEWQRNVTTLLELLALLDPATREQAIRDLQSRPLPSDTHQDTVPALRNDNQPMALKNKNDSIVSLPKTFPSYPPYPKAFESKDSIPRNSQPSTHQDSRSGAHCSGTQGTSNKIDIVCPPGSRPVIHIPPSGSPGVTCDIPRSQNQGSNYCCSSSNPCSKHR